MAFQTSSEIIGALYSTETLTLILDAVGGGREIDHEPRPAFPYHSTKPGDVRRQYAGIIEKEGKSYPGRPT